MLTLRPARFPDDADTVRAIFREYGESLGVDLGFQNFEDELASLPGKFAAPHGCVLLAQLDGNVIGCVAVRPLENGLCEMKRLYVRPAGRGQQAGRQLAVAICTIAANAGYSHIRLDTLPSMQSAQKLYTSLGFAPIDAYVFNPIAGTVFMECELAAFRRP